MRTPLLSLALISSPLLAQIPFAPLGATWTYSYEVGMGFPLPVTPFAYMLTATGDSLVGGAADAVVRDDRPVRQGIGQVWLDADVEGVTDERRGASGHDRRGRRIAVTLDEQSGQSRHEEKRREEESGAHRGRQ